MNEHGKKLINDSPVQKDPFLGETQVPKVGLIGLWGRGGGQQSNPGLRKKSASINHTLCLLGLPGDLGANIPVSNIHCKS